MNELSQNHVSSPGISIPALWRGRWTIAACMLLAIGLAVAYLGSATSVYEAEARLLVRQKGLSIDTERRIERDRQFLATEAEVLRSERTVRQALESVNVRLPKDYEKEPTVYVLDSITVTPSPDSDILRIVYRSPIESEPPKVLRAVMESYQTLVRDDESSVAGATVTLLAKQEEQLRKDLENYQRQLRAIREAGPLVGQGRESFNLHMTNLATLGDQLSKARARRFELKKKMQSFDGYRESIAKNEQAAVVLLVGALGGQQDSQPTRLASASAQTDLDDVVTLSYAGFGDKAVQNSAAAQMFRQQAESKLAQLHDVQRQLWLAKASEVQSGLSPQHPQYAAISAQIAHWEQIVAERLADWTGFLNQQVGALTAVMRQELKAAESAEVELSNLYDTAHAETKQLDNHALQEQLIQGNIQRVEQVHETVSSRLMDFKLADEALAGGRGSVVVEVLGGPELTNRKAWPQPLWILAGSAVLGCMAGVTLVSLTANRQKT